MKETPIIFSTEMVKAILEKRKTMMRRVIKPNFEATGCKNSDIVHNCNTEYQGAHMFEIWHPDNKITPLPLMIRCPYGQVGARLWLKETWWCPQRGLPVTYKANLEPYQADKQIWKSSIFMPRWASRILLEITEIRVERLQKITEEDAWAEGCSPKDTLAYRMQAYPSWNGKLRFAELWDTLNAKRGYSWTSNPWVWTISFQEITYASR